MTYADAAHLASILINESVERLDSVRLKPMIDAIKQGGNTYEVREPCAVYTH